MTGPNLTTEELKEARINSIKQRTKMDERNRILEIIKKKRIWIAKNLKEKINEN